MSLALDLNSIDAAYGPVQALFALNLPVAEGKVTAVLGPNGAGKTTSLRVAAGLLPPKKGTVSLRGSDMTGKAPRQIARSGLCLIPEGRGTFPSLTVRENLLLQCSIAGKKMAQVEERDRIRNFQPPISGDEIIKLFNLPPSRIIGELKEEIKEAILDGVIPNDREKAYQLLLEIAQKKGLKIRVIPVDDDGQILLGEYQKLLGPKTKLVSFTQVSNALGTITPARQMIELAHNAGAKVLLDGAQSVSHMRVDLQSLNPDFFVFRRQITPSKARRPFYTHF